MAAMNRECPLLISASLTNDFRRNGGAMAKDPDFFARQVTSARRFWLDLRTGRMPGLVVVSAGWERCAGDFHLARPGFPWLGIELVVEGAGRLSLAGRDHRLVAGSVFTYGPGTAHEIVGEPARPLRKYFLDLGGDDAAPLLAEAGLPPGTLAHLPAPSSARATFDLLIEAGARGGRHAPALAAALARATVLTLAAEAVAPGGAPDPAHATYLRCRKWLDEHGSTVPTLAAAAAACGVTSAHLCRLFRRYDRISPWALMRQRRLQHGAELLADRGVTIAVVAERLGYADAFHFSRAFSRAFGIPPQRYRNLAR
jgi:AraC-like DNA-binding protein